MISSFLIAASLSASGLSISLLPRDNIHVVNGEIRLGQVADLRNYDKKSRQRLSQIIIAKVPHSSQPISISTRSMQRWASAAVPNLQFSIIPERNIVVHNLRKTNTLHRNNCFASTVSISSGELISGKNTRPTECQGKPDNKIAYFDRKSRLVRAAGDLSANIYLGRIALTNLAIADRGIEMAFITRDGPVQVIRRVEALQPAQSGHPFFVSSSDGKVFKTVYRAEETE